MEERRRRISCAKHKEKSRIQAERKAKEKLTGNRPRLSLPELMFKAQRHRTPSNASKNSMIAYKPLNSKQADQYASFEELKTARKKVEERRHLNVLGRVIE